MKGILLDEHGEIMIENGAMKIGDVDIQVVEHVIGAFQGEYKESPLLGGNIRKMLNGMPNPFWSQDVQRQLETQHLDTIVNISEDGEVVVELN